jgi:rhodanese-related sulfurtransferase
MKQFQKILFLMAILPFLFITSCKDDDPTPVNPTETNSFSIMTEYMVDNTMDLPDVLGSWITARPATEAEIPGFLSTRYVMDIRSESVYNTGHIEGAVNSSLATIVVDAANSSGKQILVVCYSGQSASHATVALRLSGYANAQVLKWGMSSWRNDGEYDSWSGATSSAAVGHANWTMDGTAAVQTYEYPTLTSTSTDGATILAERVASMTTGGFKGVASSDVYGTPANYHINNYWAQTDVDLYGNINSAYRISPLSLANGEFKNYDPAGTNVTYCWTGQTSSMITAYLTVLGYDATSLKNGANSMIYSELEAHTWAPPTVNYPVVTN